MVPNDLIIYSKEAGGRLLDEIDVNNAAFYPSGLKGFVFNTFWLVFGWSCSFTYLGNSANHLNCASTTFFTRVLVKLTQKTLDNSILTIHC